MEALFSYKGKLYRIDGCKSYERNQFWAEEIEWIKGNNFYTPTENYRTFNIKDLLDAQNQALMTALTFLAVDE